MGLLKPVQNQQAAAKIGIFGFQGSGKTLTGFLLALGISIRFCNKAPIAMHDTENGSDFLKPLADAEGVSLLVHKSKAFRDMTMVLREAEAAECCVFLEDSITHTWDELVNSYMRSLLKPEQRDKMEPPEPQFQHWKGIKEIWARDWLEPYLGSKLHCIVNGRAGFEYYFQDKTNAAGESTGKRELVKGDTKLRAEGQFGYEPNLLIEMETEREGTVDSHGGHFIHRMNILKDRARLLNGKSFEFPTITETRPGLWEPVFNALLPHFTGLNIGGTHKASERSTSEGMFPGPAQSTWSKEKQQKTIALEEIQATMQMMWPSANDTAQKRIRLQVLSKVFGTRSWSAVETKPLADLLVGGDALRRLELASKNQGFQSEEDLLEHLELCLVDAKDDAARATTDKYMDEQEPLEIPF